VDDKFIGNVIKTPWGFVVQQFFDTKATFYTRFYTRFKLAVKDLVDLYYEHDIPPAQVSL
jgi:hypothetical protein